MVSQYKQAMGCRICTPLQENHRGVPCVPGMIVVIPACNEEAVLAETLDWLGRNLNPIDRVHVIADHCSDYTARIATKRGAITHIRSRGPLGKGAAIRWWLDRTRRTGEDGDMILILDADSQIAPDLVFHLRKRIDAGQPVIQTRIAPLVFSDSPIAILAGFSDVVEHSVKDALRSRLGWPVRLRGTGMMIRRDLLDSVASLVSTFVEDIELSLLLSERGIPIAYAGETYVADPKPVDSGNAARQRARWFSGQLQVLRAHRATLISLCLQGLPGWSLLSSIFLKPATLFLLLKMLLFTLSLCASALTHWLPLLILFALFFSSLFFDLLCYIGGLRYIPDRGALFKALLQSPLYLLMWLKSLTLSRNSKGTWLRARPAETENRPCYQTFPDSAVADFYHQRTR